MFYSVTELTNITLLAGAFHFGGLLQGGAGQVYAYSIHRTTSIFHSAFPGLLLRPLRVDLALVHAVAPVTGQAFASGLAGSGIHASGQGMAVGRVFLVIAGVLAFTNITVACES